MKPAPLNNNSVTQIATDALVNAGVLSVGLGATLSNASYASYLQHLSKTAYAVFDENADLVAELNRLCGK